MPQLPPPSSFSPVPAGTHIALCYRVIDLGTQENNFQGQHKKQREIMIGWELSEETMDDGRPFTIAQTYTWSMADKAKLRIHLQNWRGRAFTEDDFRAPDDGGFDIRKILGAACQLTVMHEERNGNTAAKLVAVSPLPKQLAKLKPRPINPQEFLWLSRDEYEPTVYDGLSERVREKIAKSPEWNALADGRDPAHTATEPDPAHLALEESDDIPF